jgi:hypothetical protein
LTHLRGELRDEVLDSLIFGSAMTACEIHPHAEDRCVCQPSTGQQVIVTSVGCLDSEGRHHHVSFLGSIIVVTHGLASLVIGGGTFAHEAISPIAFLAGQMVVFLPCDLEDMEGIVFATRANQEGCEPDAGLVLQLDMPDLSVNVHCGPSLACVM